MLKANLINNISGSFLDYPDDSSMSMSLYFCGCWGYCDDCQNKELQNPNYDKGTKIFTINELLDIIKINSVRFRTNKVTLLGGDPLYPSNIDFTKELVKQLYHLGYKTCIYTGQSLEYVRLNNVDYFTFLKCGWYSKTKHVLSEKTNEYFQLASTNQQIYDNHFNLLTKNGRLYFK